MSAYAMYIPEFYYDEEEDLYFGPSSGMAEYSLSRSRPKARS
jgi:hypothetical protein